MNVERLTADRNWKDRVHERMERVYKCECQKGHEYDWSVDEEKLERNVSRVNVFECRYEGCGKVYKSSSGLTLHEKMMLRVAEERTRFEYSKCGMKVKTECAKANHERTCMGGEHVNDCRKECMRCFKRLTKANFDRHVRSCVYRSADGVHVGYERVGARGKVSECPEYGSVLPAANMARPRERHRPWDPGGEPSP